MRLSLVETYYQKLLQADQFDIARRAFRLIRDKARDPATRGLAADRLARLEMIGQPAPPIVGRDIDGRPVRLEDLRGDVVLVVFWASWCLPCAAEAEELKALASKYRDRGLRILGINVDSLQDQGLDRAEILPHVRRFLVDHDIDWPNAINAPGDEDIARTYKVEEIPANFLVGRDGTLLHADLSGSHLEEVVSRALAR